jgi:hypothetical protein
LPHIIVPTIWRLQSWTAIGLIIVGEDNEHQTLVLVDSSITAPLLLPLIYRGSAR